MAESGLAVGERSKQRTAIFGRDLTRRSVDSTQPTASTNRTGTGTGDGDRTGTGGRGMGGEIRYNDDGRRDPDED